MPVDKERSGYSREVPGARVCQSEIQKYLIQKYSSYLLINRERGIFQVNARSKNVSVRWLSAIIVTCLEQGAGTCGPGCNYSTTLEENFS